MVPKRAIEATDRILKALRGIRHQLPVHSRAALESEVQAILIESRRADAEFLDGMADDSPRHGYVNAESFHKAYEQGVREAAEALRMLA